MLTITGLVLAPLFCVTMLLDVPFVIATCLVATVFGDAAIVNAGGKTVTVEWFVGLLLIGRVLFGIGSGKAGLRIEILQRLLPLLAYGLCCVASLLVALAFFKGQIIVLPGSAGLDRLLAEPYRLMPENINQLVYLVLILLFMYALVHLASLLNLDELVRCVDLAMRCACGLAAAIVAWFIASSMFGIWFPASFFHSDIHAHAWKQSVAGFIRPSGSFAEPSALVYFFSTHLFYFWQRARVTGRVGDQVWLLLTTLMLVISTSTTAFLVLGVFAFCACLDLLLRPDGGSSRQRAAGGMRLRLAQLGLVLLLGALAVVGFKLFSTYAATIYAFIDEQLLNKQQSISYEVRSNADLMAWRIFLESYGLGVGLGSHRPSSGLLTLLIGPGVLGTLLFILLVVSIMRPQGPNRVVGASRAVRWASLGPLTCHVIASPDFQSLTLWIPLALALAMQFSARINMAAKQYKAPSAGAKALAVVPLAYQQ